MTEQPRMTEREIDQLVVRTMATISHHIFWRDGEMYVEQEALDALRSAITQAHGEQVRQDGEKA